MKITPIHNDVEVFTISDSRHKLDPITVMIQDIAPGQGRITITCYDQSWTASWGAMGTVRTVRKFVRDMCAEYIVDCLQSGTTIPADKDAREGRDAYMHRIVLAVQEALRQEPTEGRNPYSDGPVWKSFGLTRASYAVFPRRALQSMPWGWQERLVALIDEAHARLPEDALSGDYTVLIKDGNRFAKDPRRNYRHTSPYPLRERADG